MSEPETNATVHIDTADQIRDNFINPLKILNLCANLSSHTISIDIQIIINKFLQQITGSPCVFIIPIFLELEEGLIQVIGDKILEKEMRFPIEKNDIFNASRKNFHFCISGMNRNFRNMMESFIGTKHNTLFFDIVELNKNSKSILTTMERLEPSQASSATGSTNCSRNNLNYDLLSKNDNVKITLFIGIAGEESCRIYYRYCIYETLRFTIGHLLTAIQLNEEKILQNITELINKVPRHLTGKIDCELKPNREDPRRRHCSVILHVLQNVLLTNKFAYKPLNFEQLTNFTLNETTNLIGGEYSFLFLRERHTGELISVDKEQKADIKIHRNIGIVSHVANTGKLFNMHHKNSTTLFNPCVDEQFSDSRNILFFPIFDELEVIGVALIYNKVNGYHFDKRDEETVKLLSPIIALGILNELLPRKFAADEARHKLQRDLLIYHMKITEEEVNQLIDILDEFPNNKIDQLNSFTFLTRELNHLDTLKASLQMFYDLNFIQKYNITPRKLVEFLLITNRYYRDLKYHNWMHGFTSAHFAYCLLMNCNIIDSGVLSELEAFSFLIAAFCHDIDHKGFSNLYHKLTKSELRRSYSKTEMAKDSTNEVHHAIHAQLILIDENTTILDSFNSEDIEIILKATEDFILATNPITKDNFKKNMEAVSSNEKFSTMSILMASCNLSDHVKDLQNSEDVTYLLCEELFEHGEQYNNAPRLSNDAKKIAIPKYQLEFLTDVCLPVYKKLKIMFPDTDFLVEYIEEIIEELKNEIALRMDE